MPKPNGACITPALFSDDLIIMNCFLMNFFTKYWENIAFEVDSNNNL